MALRTPLPARSRAGALRKEAASRSAAPRKRAAVDFSTPIRSRAGAKLLELRGWSSATPRKDLGGVKAATIQRASSYSPRALLAARARGTPSPLRRLRGERATADAPAARVAVPSPRQRTTKRFARMASYKQRNPVEIKLAPIPKPCLRTRQRGIFTEKKHKILKDKNSINAYSSEEFDTMPSSDEDVTTDNISFTEFDHGFIKHRTKGGKAAYINGKWNRYAMLKKSYEKSVFNG